MRPEPGDIALVKQLYASKRSNGKPDDGTFFDVAPRTALGSDAVGGLMTDRGMRVPDSLMYGICHKLSGNEPLTS